MCIWNCFQITFSKKPSTSYYLQHTGIWVRCSNCDMHVLGRPPADPDMYLVTLEVKFHSVTIKSWEVCLVRRIPRSMPSSENWRVKILNFFFFFWWSRYLAEMLIDTRQGALSHFHTSCVPVHDGNSRGVPAVPWLANGWVTSNTDALCFTCFKLRRVADKQLHML